MLSPQTYAVPYVNHISVKPGEVELPCEGKRLFARTHVAETENHGAHAPVTCVIFFINELLNTLRF